MTDDRSLVELIGLDKLKELQEHFFRATGFPNSFVDIDGNYVSHAGEAAYACMNIMRKNEEGCKRCITNDIRLTKNAPIKDDLNIYKCHADIWDASAPVIAGGRHLGYVFIGQCLTESPNETKVKAYANELGINPEYYWEHYKALPMVEYEKLEQAGELLFFMASAIAEEAFGKYLARQETEQLKKAKQEIAENETRFRELFNNMRSCVAIYDSPDDGQNFILKNLNDSGLRYIQTNRENVYDRKSHEVFPNLENIGLLKIFKRVWKTHKPQAHVGEIWDKNNLMLRMESYVYKLPSGELVVIFEDTTEALKLEQEKKSLSRQLLQSKKMEALGKLTGGVAHDYNNLLGIILGFSELLNENLTTNNKLKKYSLGIQKAVERGIKLTKKLLKFSQLKASENSVVNLNSLIEENQLMLEKTFTANIKLIFDPAADIWSVELDVDDLEDAIINICINAMQAMKSNGILTIRTRNKRLTAKEAIAINLNSGDYVVLSISDTGCGMDAITKEKLFDPFYTTKGSEGTGLGLSQVYGFVERSGGGINVFSELGHGSQFDLYFPRSQKSVTASMSKSNSEEIDLNGNETILLVDDELDMIELAKDILNTQGYHVLTATDGNQALALLEKEHVDLMITDVIMPNMNGFQLATQVQKNFPKTNIQIVSGFANDQYNGLSGDPLRDNILYKPYSSKTLLTRIRKILGNNNLKDGLKGRTILVMDDEEDIRDLFSFHLNKLGCKTIQAENGDDALRLYNQTIENNKFIDAIILDLNIHGGMDGKILASKILTINPNAKLIVASGNSEGQEMINYKDFGFCAALEKNFNREEIKHLLEQVIFEE